MRRKKIKLSLVKSDYNRLSHDIRVSASTIQVLLRQYERGEFTEEETLANLKSRFESLANQSIPN